MALLAFVIAVLLLVLLPGEEAEAKRTAIQIPLNIKAPTVETYTIEEPLPPSNPWQDVTVKSGDNLSLIFERVGLGPRDVHEIMTTSESPQPLSRLHPGQQLSFQIEDNKLAALKIRKDKLSSLLYERTAQGFDTSEQTREPEIRTHLTGATISSSLYKAAEDAEMPEELIMELANIFGGVMDFVYDVRAGDHFIVLYEDLYIDGEHYKAGKILAAEYVNRGHSYKAFRYTDALGDTGYYAPDGESMQKAFLRAPLKFSRISSRFDPKRLHPVFKTVRPHNGIDYAAPRGTPVYAAGDGKIIRSGYSKGNGNYVFIQHGQKYITKYLHLDRRAVKTGQRVKQGKTIGWVGSTGYATGPHLHYEFLVNGVHRNPRTIVNKLPKAKHISPTEMALFSRAIHGTDLQISTYAAQAGYESPASAQSGSG